jgi:hypothetical protein
LSVGQGASEDVSVEQIRAAVGLVSHLTRLHARLLAAIEANEKLVLSESEALLLLAEMRRSRRDGKLDELAQAINRRLAAM